MRAQVGDLVAEGLGGAGLGGGRGFEGVDGGSQLGDLAARVGVGGLQLLDAPHEGLVARDLVGWREQLSPHLVGEHEAGRQGDQGEQGQAEQLAT